MDLVIWPSPRIPLSRVLQKFNEDPATGFLNNYHVIFEKLDLTHPEFLTKIEWKILEAKLRPQFHLIVLDNTLITLENKTLLAQVCACTTEFVATHPMKYVIFYDLVNYYDCTMIEDAFYLNHKIRNQIEPLSSFARLHAHSGPPLQTLFENDTLNLTGLVQLATAIVHLVNQVVGSLND